MVRSKRSASPRFRVGRISVYPHHGAWWIDYRDGGHQIRRKVATTPQEAEQVAAQVNAQLTSGDPTRLALTSIGVPEPRRRVIGDRQTGPVLLRSGLGMTANYTHTRRETHREQIERALRLWPESLHLATVFAQGVGS